jgi:haloacetate dehalogenase
MEKVEVNGVRLAYNRRGKGTPLVLLHGYPLDHHLWDEVTPLLEDTFDLILPDLRGFGGSSTVDSFYAMEDYAADIGSLLTPGNRESCPCGHSMGGYWLAFVAFLGSEAWAGLFTGTG